MQWSDISFRPPRRTLRQFAGLWILFFGFLALWQGVAEEIVRAVALGTVALVIGIPGLLKPAAVRPLFVGWMILAFPIGWTLSRFLLGVLYYGLLTPVALIFRIMGRDALRLRPQPAAESYWLAKPAAANLQNYFHQY